MCKHHIGKSKIYVNIAEFIVKALLNRTNILPNMLDEILDICWSNINICIVCMCHSTYFIQHASPFILSFDVKVKRESG